MNLRATEPDLSSQPRASSKFAFASGARPLAGYTIKRGLGRGGFGEVYYAVSDAGKEVALKLIRSNLDIELRGVTQCLNLKHPNLLALYDVKQDDQDNSWVVMEYVSGQSLEEAMHQHPQGLPVNEALAWLRGIALGVAYLHDHGIVHRDLKPGNIFSDDGMVKLGDYGLSKFISCSRRSGQTESIGTVHYMAPEVANGRYGKEIDIYALGIIFYEMLTGHVPFEGESIGEVLMKHLTAQPDLTSLTEPYRTIVSRALAKDPALRFKSVQELIDQLPPTIGPAPPPLVGTAKRSPDAPAARVPRVEPARAAMPHLAELVDSIHCREPIARALEGAWHKFQRIEPGAKIAIIVLVVCVTIVVPVIPLLLAPMLAVFYAFYYLVWYVVQSPSFFGASQHRQELRGEARHVSPAALSSPSAAQANAVGANASIGPRKEWHGRLASVLVIKPLREQVLELLGSLLVSAGVAAALAFVLLLLRGQPPRAEQYMWLALVSTAGAWSILVAAKLWEGRPEDGALRRFAMLMVGLSLGVLAYALAEVLLVRLPFDSIWTRGPVMQFAQNFYDSNGQPNLLAYEAYFGFLFLLVRWWRQADALRRARLGLWAVTWCILAAWLVNQFWMFPQPWGIMVAACISLSVQLASPWLPPQPRVRPQAR